MEISIRDILARHPTPGVREANIRHSVAEAVTEIFGVTVTPSQVQHEDGRFTIKVPPVLKSALLLRLEELKERLKRDGIEVGEVR
ncbi:MAG TPA: hypothetical protein VF696_01065 [Candidatus Paceibacterota bacterium]|jgi:hypothetical protein